MRNDYSAGQLTEIAKPGTRPVWLVRIDFDTGGGAPLRVTSWGKDINVTESGNTFVSNGIQVSGLDDNKPGGSVTIGLPNTDKSILALVQAEEVAGRKLGQLVRISSHWHVDGSSQNVSTADIQERFVGVLAKCAFGPVATFTCRGEALNRRAPFNRARPPWANWIVAAGTIVRWGIHRLRIED